MQSRRSFLKKISTGALAVALPYNRSLAQRARKRPNILWISTEDIGTHLGCYGNPHAKTPVLDKLAEQGLMYTNAFTIAGVCAPNRSGIITGVYPTTLGTHHMRSGGEGTERSNKPVPPAFIRCFPEYLRTAGYYCTNNSKQDYQFIAPSSAWNESSSEAHWKNRPDKNTPFFAVFNYTGTHEGSVQLTPEDHARLTERLKPSQRQNPDKLTTLPPYYPDTPVTRFQLAKYYELITAMDYWAGDLLKELQDAGEADDTIIFFWSDHGAGMPRAKRWLYDSGVHIPLIVKFPKQLQNFAPRNPGTLMDRLVSSIDLGPTVLNLAGIGIPEHMQGTPFLGENSGAERRYVYGVRDRMDERYDMIRMVRDKRFKYIRNYEPFREYYQYMNTAEKDPIIQELRRLHKAGVLSPHAEKFMGDLKPVEELYDLEKDPYELNNLAQNPEYLAVLNRLWTAHRDWMLHTRDLGLIPEPELARLDSALGSRYGIFRQPGGDRFLSKLFAIASMAGRPDRTDLPMLVEAAADSQPAVRYWAVVGIGNLGGHAVPVKDFVLNCLVDESPVVRVAASRALCFLEQYDEALNVLVRELACEHEWVRLFAAIVLDSIGEHAEPAIPALEKALEDTENKYVVRVANRTLNKLRGTDNQVR
ncbi:sulfatase-like hydrolase/transferase [candidate division KSB1 bacterium]|nr:sulfatase-like hydrolase/transferase [candidate division KSB1 bacterium]